MTPALPARLRRVAPVLALLVAAAFTAPACAQPGIPQPPRPPNFPKFPNNPPNFPNNPPSFPNNPPNFPNNNLPNFPNNPPGIPEQVWYCERCGRELSRGAPAPIGTICPGCGAKITSIDPLGIHSPPGGVIPPAGPGMPPGASGPGNAQPPAGPPNNFQPAQPLVNPPVDFDPLPASPAAMPSGSNASLSGLSPGATAAIAAGVVIVLLGLAILGGAAIFIICSMNRSSPVPRPRRRCLQFDD